MNENQEGTAFSGNKRKQIEAAMKSKLGDKNLPEDFLMKFKKFGKWALYVLLGLFVVTLFADIVIGNYIYGLVNEAASDYHWLSRYSGAISIIAAVVFSFPVFWSMVACAVGAGKVKHVVTLIICVFLVLLGAYNAKYQYFAEGAGDKEICMPLLATEKAKVGSKGVGAKYGQDCIALTKENTPLAYAIEKNGLPPKEISIYEKELPYLKLMQNGAPVLYRGIRLSDGSFRVYEGPWFDEDKKGEFTKPILKIEELEALQKIINERVAKQSLDIEAIEAKRLGEQAAAEEIQQTLLKREKEKEEAKRNAEEKKAAEKQKEYEKKLDDALKNRKGMSLEDKDFYLIPYGYMVVISKKARFKVNGVKQTDLGEKFFRQNNGKVIAECDSFISCVDSHVIMQKMVD